MALNSLDRYEIAVFFEAKFLCIIEISVFSFVKIFRISGIVCQNI